MAVTDLDRAILELRVCFHRRLSILLDIETDEEIIRNLAEQQGDEDLFHVIEIESQNRRANNRSSRFGIVRFARDSKLLAICKSILDENG